MVSWFKTSSLQHLISCSFHFFRGAVPVSCSPTAEWRASASPWLICFQLPRLKSGPDPSPPLSQILQDRILSILNLGLGLFPCSHHLTYGCCLLLASAFLDPALLRGVPSPERCGLLPLPGPLSQIRNSSDPGSELAAQVPAGTTRRRGERAR